jgi:predicted ribosome quality control (RQC) complex YloA/Tae2 family protein
VVGLALGHQPWGDESMSDKNAYEQKLEAQLKIWQAEIDKLRAQAEKASADARLRYDRQVDELVAYQKQGKEKLRELQGANEQAWADMRQGMEQAWDDMAKAWKDAMSRYS